VRRFSKGHGHIDDITSEDIIWGDTRDLRACDSGFASDRKEIAHLIVIEGSAIPLLIDHLVKPTEIIVDIFRLLPLAINGADKNRLMDKTKINPDFDQPLFFISLSPFFF
jgi:hypothetical protein